MEINIGLAFGAFVTFFSIMADVQHRFEELWVTSAVSALS